MIQDLDENDRYARQTDVCVNEKTPKYGLNTTDTNREYEKRAFIQRFPYTTKVHSTKLLLNKGLNKETKKQHKLAGTRM